MNRLLLVVLTALLTGAPIELSARQVVKHHTAKAQERPSTQAANPNCAFGATPPAGTSCDTSDYTPGGALSNTDTIQICQKPGGCFGTSTTISRNSIQLLPDIRSSFTGTSPIVVNNSTGAISCPTCGTTGGAPPGSAVWTGAVSGTNTYTATSAQGSFANTAGKQYVFCGTFQNASTGAATLNVDGAGALPIDVQYGATSTAAAGAGDIPGGNVSICLQQNAGSTAWIKQTQVPGAVVVDPGAHTVTPFEWSTGYTFVYSPATPIQTVLTIPSVAGLSPQGGVTVSTITAITVQPAAGDGINAQPAGISQDIAPNIVTLITTSGSVGSNALIIPQGPLTRYTLTWGPGMNLATSPLPIVNSRAYQTHVTGNLCTPAVLVAGTPANIDVYAAPEGTSPNLSSSPNITNCTGCTKISTGGLGTSGACAAGTLGTAGVTQVLFPGPALVRVLPSTILWAVGSGAGWTTANVANSSGLLQVNLQP